MEMENKNWFWASLTEWFVLTVGAGPALPFPRTTLLKISQAVEVFLSV